MEGVSQGGIHLQRVGEKKAFLKFIFGIYDIRIAFALLTVMTLSTVTEKLPHGVGDPNNRHIFLLSS